MPAGYLILNMNPPSQETCPIPGTLPNTRITYIGPLSRFEKIKSASATNNLLILLSGPEPQRTIFEEIIIRSTQQL